MKNNKGFNEIFLNDIILIAEYRETIKNLLNVISS